MGFLFYCFQGTSLPTKLSFQYHRNAEWVMNCLACLHFSTSSVSLSISYRVFWILLCWPCLFGRFCHGDMEREHIIDFYNLLLCTLFITVCDTCTHIALWQQWIRVTVNFPRPAQDATLFCFPSFLRVLSACKYPWGIQEKECRLEELLPLDMCWSPLLSPLCPSTFLYSLGVIRWLTLGYCRATRGRNNFDF